MAHEPRTNRPTAIHPRLLTLAVTALHIVATMMVLYELDLQHYQTAKKQLVTENFDDYLTLPTESLKGLAVEALYNPFPDYRARALTELHTTVERLLQDPSIPAFRFVLRDPTGTVLLDRADSQKPGRLENWTNRLFLPGFSGFVDMRLPQTLSRSPGEILAVGRLQAYYASPVDKPAVAALTRYYQWVAGALLLASALLYALLHRTLLRPMESVSLRLEDSRSAPPRLIPRPASLLESGFNRMALQALLQQLDQILEPLLRPNLPREDVLPTVQQGLEFMRDHFPTERILILQLGSTDQDLQILESWTAPPNQVPTPEELAFLKELVLSPNESLLSRDWPMVGATVQLPGQFLAALGTVTVGTPDPALARHALLSAVPALLRPLAAAYAMHQELFRQSREANIVLSRNLGHDLTNIIATAKLDLAVLRRLLDADLASLTGRKRDMIQTSVTALLDTTRFLQEVVNIYRAFSFLKRPIREPAHLQEMLSGFVAAFRPSVSARVDIQFAAPEEPIHATVETRLLKLALFNLMQNALDAIKRRPDPTSTAPSWIRIQLATGVLPDGQPSFTIEISDNGPGLCDAQGQPLAPAAIPAIFGFGYSTKDREVNEGLGLAWVRTIVEEFHGGRIEAENQEPQGALFRITLPAHPPVMESHPTEPARPDSAAFLAPGHNTTP